MALDTQQKRMSAAYCGVPALPPSVYPSGAIDAPERLNAGWSYAGIVLSAPAAIALRLRMLMGVGR